MNKLDTLINSNKSNEIFEITKNKRNEHKKVEEIMNRIVKNAKFVIPKNNPEAIVKEYNVEPNIEICNRITYDIEYPSEKGEDEMVTIDVKCCGSDCTLSTRIPHPDVEEGIENKLAVKLYNIYEDLDIIYPCIIEEHPQPHNTHFHSTCITDIKQIEKAQREVHKILE